MATSAASLELDGLKKVWELGATVPETIHDCVHNLVARTVASQPQAPAVCAWDGELTYKELDELASKLAAQLVNLGIGSGDIVSLCFEKSMWAVVAMLGVLKAGAGFVLFDQSLPEERLRSIVQQTRGRLILSSCLNGELASRLSPLSKTMLVGPTLAEDDGPLLSPGYPAPHPSSIAYVVFTSGSTGIPKGCVMSHENFCSALHYQVPWLGYKSSSRAFDSTPYCFDVAIHNLFAAWTTGGCVCIPRNEDLRNDLAKSVCQMQATLISVTPTQVRLLDPETVPKVETVILVGEIVTKHDIQAWWGKQRNLINAYGTSECSVFSTINSTFSSPAMLESIGVDRGAMTWIVDPTDHNILMPWGQIGELLIEGPLVGLGYLNNPEKTTAAFIEDPSWLVRGAFGVPGRRGRLYKTGDLGRHDEDGNLVVIGRKDTQVQIRGNRIELGEIEVWVQASMPEVKRVIAEAFIPKGLRTGFVLAAFLVRPEIGTPFEAKRFNIGKDVETKLARHLPADMMPDAFFTVSELPLTMTGKTNRKLLREIGASLFVEHVTQ